MSASFGIRNVIMRHSASVSHTVALKVQSKTVSTATFVDAKVYEKQPAVKQAAIQDVIHYAAKCGADAGGAETAEIAGGYHAGGKGVDKFDRLTVLMKNKNGAQLYFYRQSDKTFWERLHIPKQSDSKNKALWERHNDYVAITKEQFDKKQAPGGKK